MKTLIYLVTIVTLIISLNQAKSDCPQGYSPGSSTYIYNQLQPPAQCTVVVDYCWKVSPLGILSII